MNIFLIYVACANFIGFCMMHLDKSYAKKGEWRIPEAKLFQVSLLGGSLGTWLGMYMFRHKTKHWYFVVGMPLIFFIHVALVVLFVWKVGL